ncbi:hypothetical protein vBYenM636_50 [Yersinia phage vB_YenM_636]|nr:hypothetical protein vBYenM12_50 [Yersinia phage vB_YenM_12]QKN86392.1 hypothetical protein vBYenM22_50 [Yersinia phage vB_YenM_22]QKN86483.1 hypothetical protein vBYenM25_50 [Yersinia phage vB_YenM_25]QKN86574.1 hypothetical protein vBYenM27_50 [Yersinia phage vB_YenM_27]QKN86665.1 hypothetical protein vBYenM39_50 [Yersinia phage vB_YenM_39]QKN86756.1 hypothetical protein vBYenM126_50 [Yersinia phage vB_YenM_126]QKN86847.1 hypothetical protein vBYenM526-1_50 [Yersinia phage vB_YenM_526-1]
MLAKLNKAFWLLLIAILISGCQSGRVITVPVVVDTSCDWVEVIRPTLQDIKVMDLGTKRQIVYHNEMVEKMCSKEL